MEELREVLTNSGEVTVVAIDECMYPGSLFKLPRFVAKGLHNKIDLEQIFKRELELLCLLCISVVKSRGPGKF